MIAVPGIGGFTTQLPAKHLHEGRHHRNQMGSGAKYILEEFKAMIGRVLAKSAVLLLCVSFLLGRPDQVYRAENSVIYVTRVEDGVLRCGHATPANMAFLEEARRGERNCPFPFRGFSFEVSIPGSEPVQQTFIVGSGFYKDRQMALDFAHFGNGDSFSSDVVLVNLAATPIQPLVFFYDKSGKRIDPESLVDVMDNLQATSFGALTLQSELPSLGEVTISTNGMGDLVTGSVKVVTEGLDSPIGGVLRFDVPGVGVAGVGASQPLRDAIIPVRRQTGGVNTGAALRNLSESELELSCRLMMGGEMIEMQPVTLPANGQDAMFISELFDHDTSDFTGSVRCTATSEQGDFTGVAVEMDDMNGIFTTLPVVPVGR